MIEELPNKGRILVIDNDNETANLIKLILSGGGDYEVWRTDDPEEGLSIVNSEDIDLILCEGFNESVASFSLCESLMKANQGTQRHAIVFYADTHDQKSLLRAFDVGAVDYLRMPSYPMEFKARVKNHTLVKRQRDVIVQKMSEQKELIHIMCHDINGPVGVPLQLLKFGRDEPSIILESLDSIISSLGKAIELTDMVRQLQAIEDGKKVWELESLNLKDAIEDSVSVYRQRLEEKKVNFETIVDENVSVMVERVSFVNSVISNLISNSIKFSEPGATITASARKEADKVLFTISDQGIGMPDKIAENLFNLNVPTSREGTQNEQGTGYGMPLVKKFVLSYGGEVNVHSKDIKDYPEDHGTSFEIVLQPGD